MRKDLKMKDDEPIKSRDLPGLGKKVTFKKNMSFLTKRLVDFFRENPLEKTQEEQLLEKIRDLHRLTMEKAKIHAPNILRTIRFEEAAKESRTRQEFLILATNMITCLLNELNQIADTSTQETNDFIEKAKSSLNAIASSHFKSRLP
jgi:hypothetical protein